MTTVVIMAGGRGQRLHGLTDDTPKPMLYVGRKPMLETIIEKFAAQGFKRFVLCVRYLADRIVDHFGDGSGMGVDIQYIHEDEPLGTAGALRHLPKQTEPFIVSNCDVWCDIDFHDLLRAHNAHGFDATICAALYQHQVPFGVLKANPDGTVAISEKPILNEAVSGGVYVLPPYAPDVIDGPMGMDELLMKMTAKEYPIQGPWIDLGHFDSLAKASYTETLRAAK